jgi:ribosomal protein S18 acetylase RimI-like enzyme
LLRVATVHDASFISRTVISSWQDAYRDFLPWSFLASLNQNVHHDRQAWESRISEPGSVTWIISDTRNDVGVLRIVTSESPIPGTDSVLTTLYLLRQARGHGLGSKALAFARAEAARRARPILGVCVLAGNKAGQAFYERRGARRIGERVAFRLDKEPVIDILYRFASVVVESPPALIGLKMLCFAPSEALIDEPSFPGLDVINGSQPKESYRDQPGRVWVTVEGTPDSLCFYGREEKAK